MTEDEGGEPGATDNLGYAQRIWEGFRFRSSPARCLSFIVRQGMKAVIESLMSNHHPEEDEPRVHAERDPSDDLGWFSVRVGGTDEIGSTDFQVVVATPRAMPRALFSGNRRFKGLVLQSYSPDAARALIRTKVESTEGRDYSEIVEKLRHYMFWEYDDYRT